MNNVQDNNLTRRINSHGSKKILACDGGGLLGLMSVEILAKIESELWQKLNQPNLILADYFDFVCGTSTGAIIAACIASGMSMDKIGQFYIGSGEQMFDKAFLLNRLKYSYNDKPLANLLRQTFDDQLNVSGDDQKVKKKRNLGQPQPENLVDDGHAEPQH